MTQPQLPTFSKWAGHLMERRRAVAAVLFILGSLALAHEGLRRYLAAPLACDQPCRDGEDCERISLKVEVKPLRIKAGAPHQLWYRVELKNRSCLCLTTFNVQAFVDSRYLSGKTSGLWIAVIGPDGRELEMLPIPGPDGGIAWDYGSTKGHSIDPGGTIYPYRNDDTVYQQTLRTGKLDENFYLDLDPGESFATIPSKIRPYRLVATSTSHDGGIADGIAHVDVEHPPSFPAPPTGFQTFDRYAFKRPGRYLIKFGYVSDPGSDIVRPHWEALPASVKKLFYWIGLWPGMSYQLSAGKILLETEPIILEVLP